MLQLQQRTLDLRFMWGDRPIGRCLHALSNTTLLSQCLRLPAQHIDLQYAQRMLTHHFIKAQLVCALHCYVPLFFHTQQSSKSHAVTCTSHQCMQPRQTQSIMFTHPPGSAWPPACCRTGLCTALHEPLFPLTQQSDIHAVTYISHHCSTLTPTQPVQAAPTFQHAADQSIHA
jgi:hypothetical protein